MRDPKILLTAEEMPRQWYNLAADLPKPPPPPLGPDGNPVGPDALAPVFPMNLIEQEVSQDRWIDIPDGVLELLWRYRPSPLRRAYALEEALGTPAKIYYKDESVSPAGREISSSSSVFSPCLSFSKASMAFLYSMPFK